MCVKANYCEKVVYLYRKLLQMNKSIFLVDDHNVFLDGVKSCIENSEGNYQVVGCAANGKDAVSFCTNNEVDLIIMDINMPVMNGIEATSEILKNNPDQRILILSMQNEPSIIRKAMEAGARGYLNKAVDFQELFQAIDFVIDTGFYINPEVSEVLIKALTDRKKFVETNDGLTFSRREVEIIKLICDEKSTNDIADDLDVSIRTVEIQRKNLMEKIGVKNVVGIVMYAVKHDLIDN